MYGERPIVSDFITKDSGERQDFTSGARRDISRGKDRYDLIPLKALKRWAGLMGRGAEKYGDRNWEKGMPATRFSESALRHFFQYMEGDRTEDHLAAVLFNIGSMIHFENGQWDDINGSEQDYGFDEHALMEWVLDVAPTETYTQPELPFEEPQNVAQSLINWESLKREVDEGRTEKSEVNWPEWHPYHESNYPDEG